MSTTYATLAATLASVSATVLISPWRSASVAWIVVSSSPPANPIIRIAPSVAATTGAAVSPTVPAANSAAADHSSRLRPTRQLEPRAR